MYKTLKSLQLYICFCFLKNMPYYSCPTLIYFSCKLLALSFSKLRIVTLMFSLYTMGKLIPGCFCLVVKEIGVTLPGSSCPEQPHLLLPRAAVHRSVGPTFENESMLLQIFSFLPIIEVSYLFFCTELSLHNLWTPTLSKFSLTYYLLLNMKNCSESHRLWRLINSRNMDTQGLKKPLSFRKLVSSPSTWKKNHTQKPACCNGSEFLIKIGQCNFMLKFEWLVIMNIELTIE